MGWAGVCLSGFAPAIPASSNNFGRHWAIQRHVPGYYEKALPVSTSSRPEFPPEQRRVFTEVLKLMNKHKVPYAVSGAFALYEHTGIGRDTKDLDLFIPADHVGAALGILRDHNFECGVYDPVWLAKAHRGDYFVDIITGMSNGVIIVDDSWIQRAAPSRIMGIPARVLAAEELIASKIFVTRRERFDGADIAHVIYGTRGRLDWQRLFALIGEHWELLLWSLILFRYCYPAQTNYVPREIWDELLGRFQKALADGDGTPFRGSLVDELMFAVDVHEWGMANIIEDYRERRQPKITMPPARPDEAA